MEGGEDVEGSLAADVADQAKFAGQVADLPRRTQTVAKDVGPEDRDRARSRSEQSESKPDERRLPRAIRAEKAEALTALDRQIDVAQRCVRPVLLCEAVSGERYVGEVESDRRPPIWSFAGSWSGSPPPFRSYVRCAKGPDGRVLGEPPGESRL